MKKGREGKGREGKGSGTTGTAGKVFPEQMKVTRATGPNRYGNPLVMIYLTYPDIPQDNAYKYDESNLATNVSRLIDHLKICGFVGSYVRRKVSRYVCMYVWMDGWMDVWM